MLMSPQNPRGLFIKPLTKKTVGTGNCPMAPGYCRYRGAVVCSLSSVLFFCCCCCCYCCSCDLEKGVRSALQLFQLLNICNSPAGRSVLGKTEPEVYSAVSGGPQGIRHSYFPIRCGLARPVNKKLYFLCKKTTLRSWNKTRSKNSARSRNQSDCMIYRISPARAEGKEIISVTDQGWIGEKHNLL